MQNYSAYEEAGKSQFTMENIINSCEFQNGTDVRIAKGFKIPIITMPQEAKASTLEMNRKIENLNKETEDIKRSQMEIRDLKNTMTEI